MLNKNPRIFSRQRKHIGEANLRSILFHLFSWQTIFVSFVDNKLKAKFVKKWHISPKFQPMCPSLGYLVHWKRGACCEAAHGTLNWKIQNNNLRLNKSFHHCLLIVKNEGDPTHDQVYKYHLANSLFTINGHNMTLIWKEICNVLKQ